MSKPSTALTASELRRKAEENLALNLGPTPCSEPDALRVLHELQVYQVELKMQNETLRQTQEENLVIMAKLVNLNEHLEEIVEMRTAELNNARKLAEAASQTKSVFLANMSHELRTPMTAILGMTDLALRHATDSKQIDQLGKAQSASRHLLMIINDILDLSKIEADRLKLECINLTLDSVLENVVSMLKPKIAEKGLNLSVEIGPELVNRSLEGDPTRLTQILMNLVGNAVKFTTRGTIFVRALVVEENPGEVLLRWEVEDTGIGIAAVDVPRLFSAFEQADSSMTRKYGGTGLGLAITKRLSGLMGGQVGVESTLGQGSVFWFTARLKEAFEYGGHRVPANCDHGTEKELQRLHAGARVLLVDDDPMCWEITQTLLENNGLICSWAADGAAAITMAQQTDFALILMDMQMPVMNGADATRGIRALPGREHTPIVAMSANVLDATRQQCISAGMNDFIAKPLTPEALFGTVLTWLEFSQQRTS